MPPLGVVLAQESSAFLIEFIHIDRGQGAGESTITGRLGSPGDPSIRRADVVPDEDDPDDGANEHGATANRQWVQREQRDPRVDR
ncbi:MAG: hypothetical protein VX726_06980 [Planctomycetota bacterium]|nr:hypothetical protein [Planctomycetota bacterium]MEE2895474.1 hypothetical protein [Planctomycetota bacterium]